MKDKYSEERISQLHPQYVVRDIFRIFIEECENTLGITLRIMLPVFRSVDEQNELYSHGRNGDTRPKVTDAKGGTSYHNYGLAVDLCVIENGSVNWNYDMSNLKSIAEKYNDGLEWGGDWIHMKDKPHFELRKVNGVIYQENCSDLAVLPKDKDGYPIFS